MGFESPDINELKSVAASLGHDFDDNTLQDIVHYMTPFAEGYKYLDEQEDYFPPLQYPNRSYRFPEEEENKLGAWYVLCHLKGKESGPLHGRRIAIKDNIFVADVPLMNGASIMEGFVPDFDATVVTRLLDAGADIAGKAVCEFMCMSGGSATASSGIVDNPIKSGYSAGGSSSGSAALVGSGEIGMALGCDQAGSVRIPSSFCGTYGMKATHGLIPYTGIIGMEAMLDNVGPITANVADNALLLEVLAGYDELDSRQRQLQLHKYTQALGESVKNIKIGIVKEGFAHPFSDPLVDDCVREASLRLESLGIEIEEVSIPMHPEGVAIWGGILTDGVWETLRYRGSGYNYNSVYSPALFKAMQNWESKLDQFPINVLLIVLLGKYMERYQGKYYAKSKNLLIALRKAYDTVLAKYDLLLMPTCVQKPSSNPATQAELTSEQIISLAFNTVLNTCQFDITGHPAMSIPCGMRDGLPIGLMLIGKNYDEPAIYRVAHALEQSGNWREY